MGIIPIPIFIPGDVNSSLMIPDAVGVILFGGFITVLIGIVLALIAVAAELVFNKDYEALVKISVVLTVAGVIVAIIGLILVLITGKTVEV